jgi:hypothetical protein
MLAVRGIIGSHQTIRLRTENSAGIRQHRPLL